MIRRPIIIMPRTTQHGTLVIKRDHVPGLRNRGPVITVSLFYKDLMTCDDYDFCDGNPSLSYEVTQDGEWQPLTLIMGSTGLSHSVFPDFRPDRPDAEAERLIIKFSKTFDDMLLTQGYLDINEVVPLRVVG